MLQYIDISHYNKMVSSEINADGVILRIGYTGYGSNKPALDKSFEKFYKIYHNLGVPIGIYYVTIATTEKMVDTETAWVLDKIKDKRIDLPIWVDVESQVHSAGWTNLNKAVRSSLVARWCQNVQNAGYYCGVYANLDWLKNKLDKGILAPYDKWVAQYYGKCGYTGKYGMWQYTSKELGDLHGFTGEVDASHVYVDYKDVIKTARLNHLEDTTQQIKSLDEVAQEVIDGKWGNGLIRRARLTSAGYVYKDVQEIVNRIIAMKGGV